MKAAGAVMLPEDNRAIDDSYNALRDLRRRIAPGLAALDAIGAADDSQGDSGTTVEEPAMQPDTVQRAITALHEAGLKQPAQLRGFGRRLGQMFAPPAPAPATNGEGAKGTAAKPETPAATPAAPAKTDIKQN